MVNFTFLGPILKAVDHYTLAQESNMDIHFMHVVLNHRQELLSLHE